MDCTIGIISIKEYCKGVSKIIIELTIFEDTNEKKWLDVGLQDNVLIKEYLPQFISLFQFEEENDQGQVYFEVQATDSEMRWTNIPLSKCLKDFSIISGGYLRISRLISYSSTEQQSPLLGWKQITSIKDEALVKSFFKKK